MALLKWIHISDIHIKSSTKYLEKYNRKVVLDSLWNDISRRDSIDGELGNLDFAFITGDIAWSGDDTDSSDEYEEVVNSLVKPLSDSANIKMENIFIVPGNHDIARSKIDSDTETIEKEINSKDAILELFVSPEKKEDKNNLFHRLDNYINFVSENFPHIKLNKENCTYAQKVRAQNSDAEILVVGLNSVWLAHGGEEDKGKLALGEPILLDLFKTIDDKILTISLVHHPISGVENWYKDIEYNCRNLVKTKSDFLLCGHVHESDVCSNHSFQGPLVTLVGGSIYENREWRSNSYNYVVFNTDTLSGTTYLRRYQESTRGPEWIRDIESTGDQNIGKMPISIIKAGNYVPTNVKESKPAATEPDPNIANFLKSQFEFLNKRPLLSESYPDRDTMDILFPEIYIDPLVKPRKHPLSKPIPLSEWISANHKSMEKILLLGPAGSGKTTSLIKIQIDFFKQFDANTNAIFFPIFFEARSYFWDKKLELEHVLTYAYKNLQTENIDLKDIYLSDMKPFVLMDAIDEAFPSVYQEYGSFDFNTVLFDFPHIASCRIDFFERNLSDAAFTINYDEILELEPWKIDREVTTFLENYFNKFKLADKDTEITQVKHYLELSSGEKELPLIPLTVTAFLFIWQYSRDEIEGQQIESFSILLNVFITLWAKREISAQRTAFESSTRLFKAYEFTAWILYKTVKKSPLKMTELCVELSSIVGIEPKILMKDRGLLSLLRMKKSPINSSLIVLSFIHEALYEFLLASKVNNVLFKNDHEIEILDNLLGYTINKFSRELISSLSLENKQALIHYLRDEYFRLYRLEYSKIFQFRRFLLNSFNFRSNKNERTSKRVIRRHNLTYFWGRTECEIGGKLIQELYQDFVDKRITDHVMVVNTIGSCLLFLDNFHLESMFLNNLSNDSQYDLCNRTYHRVYYGDEAFTDPDSFLVENVTTGIDDWQKTRQAILYRLKLFSYRAQCLRGLDLVTFRRLCETRGIPSLNHIQIDIIKSCINDLSLVSEEKANNIRILHQQLLELITT